MKCPYCNSEMLSGYIPNGNQPVQWLPDREKPSLFSFTIAGKGVALVNEFAPLKANGYKATAFYCAECKIVIAPTEGAQKID